MRWSKNKGISVIAGGSPEIANNTVSDNNSRGIAYTATASFYSGQVKIHDNLVERNGAEGIYVGISGSAVTGQTLGGNSVNQNSGQAIVFGAGATQAMPANVTQNSLSGNSKNGIWLSGKAPTSSWNTSFPLVNQGVTVGSGQTLTIAAGEIIKSIANTEFVVNGTLNAQGSVTSPVYFTSISDDSHGGDTNGDGGASSPARGDWQRIRFDVGSSGSLDHVNVAYAGRIATTGAAVPAVQIDGASPQVTNSTIAQNFGDGIGVTQGYNTAAPTIANNEIHDNGFTGIRVSQGGSPAIYGNHIYANPGSTADAGGIDYSTCPSSCSSYTGQINIHDNTVESNGGVAGIRVNDGFSGSLTGQSIGANQIRNNAGMGLSYWAQASWGHTIPTDIDTNTLQGNGKNGIWVGGAVGSSATWSARGYAFVFSDLRIQPGATLTLAPGFVFKGQASNSSIDVIGDLHASGESGNPITITSLKDDSAGGDTNGDGTATTPARGDWGSIQLGYSSGSNSGAGVFDHVKAAYGNVMFNFYFVPSCHCDRVTTITHSALTNANSGISATNPSSAPPVLAWNTIKDNASYGINGSGTGTIVATGTDFGAENGPAPRGSGNQVSSDVQYTTAVLQVNCVGNPFNGGQPYTNADLAVDPRDPGSLERSLYAIQTASTLQLASHSEGSQCPEDADPVSLATGALTYGHTDLRLSGKSFPLLFRRSYTSNDPADAGLGPGWSQTGLILAAETESGDVIVRRPDGRRDLFTKDGSSYDPPSGIHDVLIKKADGTFKLTTQGGTVYDFNATEQLATITDQHGLVTTYGYNTNGRLSTITDPSGQSLSFGYNVSNHITSVTDSTGRSVTYTYDSAGNLATVTDPLSGVTHYAYDAQHRMTSITDPRNITILTNTYDSQGRITEQVDGENNHWSIDYGSGETTVTEPEGGQKTFAFDADKRVTAVTDELGHTTTRHYDAAGNVDQVVRPGGAQWSYDHDSAGNLTSITDPLSGVQSLSYDSANHPTSYTDRRNDTWNYTWSSNNLTEVADPASGTISLTYNGAGQPLTVTDPNNHTTTNTYDTRGNLTSVTDPLNQTTSYGYNSRNNLTSKTEPGHSAETYTRNALGDMLSDTTPAGNTTSYSYDANGALTSMTDPATNTWAITRDGMERPSAYTDPLGHSTAITYDGNLNPVTVTDRRGKTTTYGYDAANELTSVQRPEGDTWGFGYDARGNRNSVTDPRSHTSTYYYDLLNRMTEADEPLSTSTGYGYDPSGNLTSLTDPNGNQTTFDYNAMNERTAIHQPLGKDTSFSYDSAGNLTGRTTAVGSLSYAYDDADRLTSISSGSNTLRSYSYDASNRLTGATDAQSKTIAFGYNGDDLLTSIDDGRGQTVSRSYDSRGNLVGQTDGRGTLAFGYDALDRMTSLTDPQSQSLTFGYDHEGNLTETDLPNGVVTNNSYDGDGRMTETSSVNGTNTLQDFGYGYDPEGNRTSQTDQAMNQTTYSYDALNRLTEFAPPGGPAVDYAYDDAGNRTHAGSTTYDYNNLNQLTSSSDGTTYGYDGAGRLTSKDNGSQTTSFSWDQLDQLTGVDDGMNPITYSYDGLGRRSERIEGSSTTTLHYGDLSDSPIVKTDATPSVINSYVQGPAGLLEERDGSATMYPLADAHGDVTTVADGSGSVSSREAYDPWGNQLSGPPLENGFLGSYQRPTDPTTGLLQMGVRPYDTSLAEFMAEDPELGTLGSGISHDRYPYVLDNPVNVYDLDGRAPSLDDVLNAASDALGWSQDQLESFVKHCDPVGLGASALAYTVGGGGVVLGFHHLTEIRATDELTVMWAKGASGVSVMTILGGGGGYAGTELAQYACG